MNETDIYEVMARQWSTTRALAKARIMGMMSGKPADPADDGVEVYLFRRIQSFYDRILMAADDAHIREHCRIRNVEHEFCKKVGTL